MEDENSVTVRGITYTKLECVGRGGSSKVYKVMAPNRKIFALKRIRLAGRDAEAASGFMDEISLLTSLRGKSNIIQLIDAEVRMAAPQTRAVGWGGPFHQPPPTHAHTLVPSFSSVGAGIWGGRAGARRSHRQAACLQRCEPSAGSRPAKPGLSEGRPCRSPLTPASLPSNPSSLQVHRAEGIIYMVLECGEIDLARLLQKREAARREQGIAAEDLDENFIRLYWEQMLTVRGCFGQPEL